MGNAVDISYRNKEEFRRRQAQKEKEVYQACLAWTFKQENLKKKEDAEKRERIRKVKEYERIKRDHETMEIWIKNLERDVQKTNQGLRKREKDIKATKRVMSGISNRRTRENVCHIEKEREVMSKNFEMIRRRSIASRENMRKRIQDLENKKNEDARKFIHRISTAEKEWQRDLAIEQKRIKCIEKKIVQERVTWQKQLLAARQIPAAEKISPTQLWEIGKRIVDKRKQSKKTTIKTTENRSFTPNKIIGETIALVSEKDTEQMETEKSKPIKNSLSTVNEEELALLETEESKVHDALKLDQSRKSNICEKNKSVELSSKDTIIPNPNDADKELVSQDANQTPFIEAESGGNLSPSLKIRKRVKLNPSLKAANTGHRDVNSFSSSNLVKKSNNTTTKVVPRRKEIKQWNISNAAHKSVSWNNTKSISSRQPTNFAKSETKFEKEGQTQHKEATNSKSNNLNVKMANQVVDKSRTIKHAVDKEFPKGILRNPSEQQTKSDRHTSKPDIPDVKTDKLKDGKPVKIVSNHSNDPPDRKHIVTIIDPLLKSGKNLNQTEVEKNMGIKPLQCNPNILSSKPTSEQSNKHTPEDKNGGQKENVVSSSCSPDIRSSIHTSSKKPSIEQIPPDKPQSKSEKMDFIFSSFSTPREVDNFEEKQMHDQFKIQDKELKEGDTKNIQGKTKIKFRTSRPRSGAGVERSAHLLNKRYMNTMTKSPILPDDKGTKSEVYTSKIEKDLQYVYDKIEKRKQCQSRNVVSDEQAVTLLTENDFKHLRKIKTIPFKSRTTSFSNIPVSIVVLDKKISEVNRSNINQSKEIPGIRLSNEVQVA